MGVILLLAFIGSTLVELLSGAKLSLKLWTIVTAAETIAWRMKLTLLPAAILSSYAGVRYVIRHRVAAGELPPGGRRFARGRCANVCERRAPYADSYRRHNP
jgi:hypothetical protein